MGVSKIKDLVIAALILVNILFIVVLVSDKAGDMISRAQAIENACIILREGGINIEPDNIKRESALREMRTARNPVEEERIAGVVLGPVVMDDQGVNYRYENEMRGVAVFYSSGDFLIEVKDGLVSSAGGTLKAVKTLLREMGIEASEFYQSGESGQESVTAVCDYRRVSVFNCEIRFYFSDGSLSTVSGRYITNAEPIENGAEISSPGTALLGFLAWVKQADIECTRVDEVRAGYQLRDISAFGEGVLAPVWLITADAGRYTIDAETGEIHMLSSTYRQ